MSTMFSGAELIVKDVETAMDDAGQDVSAREDRAWYRLQELVETGACTPDDAINLITDIHKSVGHQVLQAS